MTTNTAESSSKLLAPRTARAGQRARTGRVAIVDPFSTATELAGAFARRGWGAVAVLSGPPPTGLHAEMRASDYLDVLTSDPGDLEASARHLRRLDVTHVVAGSESGVILADALARLIGVPGNDPATSVTRRDKFAMSLALRNARVPGLRGVCAGTVADALAAARGIGSWPVVLKPRSSAGSDNVLFAADPDEVAGHASTVLGTRDIFGEVIESLLVQQCLIGEQYACNTVSRAGRHRVVEIWHDRRTRLPDGRLIYDRMDLLDPGDTLVAIIARYVLRCLDALGIEHGPAHSEVMLTEVGPILIETGARLQGGDSVELMRRTNGTSQTDALVETTLGSAREHAERAHQPYYYRRPVAQLLLQCPADGVIGAAEVVEELMAIPGVAGAVHPLVSGTAVRRTTDLLSSPAILYLTAENPHELEKAYAAVRKLESAGLYVPAER